MATLLHYPLCPFSRSIRLALAECGIETALTEERPWEWRPGFLGLNPAGSLPVLITDADGAIAGAYAISEYLDETARSADGRGFQPFPGDPIARAEARRLADWFHRKFHDEVTSYLVEEKVYRRFGPKSASPDMEAMRAGHDPQLERAVAMTLQLLEKNSPPTPKRPEFPNYQRPKPAPGTASGR